MRVCVDENSSWFSERCAMDSSAVAGAPRSERRVFEQSEATIELK
jgi:hypothetical protein